jgi:hypothetical protein
MTAVATPASDADDKVGMNRNHQDAAAARRRIPWGSGDLPVGSF